MEHLLEGSLPQGSRWTDCYSADDSLWMSVIFDCVKTVAGMKAELNRMSERSEFARRRRQWRFKEIQKEIARDAAWMGERGEASDYWRVARHLGLELDALEMIRDRFVRDRNEVFATLEKINKRDQHEWKSRQPRTG